MEEILSSVLPQYKNIRMSITKGVTHTTIRITGDAVKSRKSGFFADVIINRRTQEVSIARIDIKDQKVLFTIVGVLSRFQF
jgi:hypothetical protein